MENRLTAQICNIYRSFFYCHNRANRSISKEMFYGQKVNHFLIATMA